MNTELCILKMYSWISFVMYIYLWNHHLIKIINMSITPEVLCPFVISPFSSGQATTDLLSVSINCFAFPRILQK